MFAIGKGYGNLETLVSFTNKEKETFLKVQLSQRSQDYLIQNCTLPVWMRD